jgi:hypothetical protein
MGWFPLADALKMDLAFLHHEAVELFAAQLHP